MRVLSSDGTAPPNLSAYNYNDYVSDGITAHFPTLNMFSLAEMAYLTHNRPYELSVRLTLSNDEEATDHYGVFTIDLPSYTWNVAQRKTSLSTANIVDFHLD